MICNERNKMKIPKTKEDMIKLKRKLEQDPDNGELFKYMTVDKFTRIVGMYLDGQLSKRVFN